MTGLVYAKLAVIFGAVALGWLAASRGWLGGLKRGADGRLAPPPEIARTLSALAFTLLIPALLFRTMVRIDLAAMPWRTLAAFMLPLLAFAALVYAVQRLRAGLQRAGSRLSTTSTAATAASAAAAPATRAISASYGNAVQLGIPVAAALYGEQGLALHVAVVSIHGMLLLLMLTVLVELDIARAQAGSSMGQTLRTTARQLILHPVVLPVMAGLLWNLGGLGLHPLADELLAILGGAAIPLCLLLIGIALATYGLRGNAASALPTVILKLFVLPAVVLAVAHLGFGLNGMPLGVLVMMAAMPAGANALIFAQRYQALQAEVTAAVVLSTLGFVLAATFWLAVLARLAAN